MFWTLLYSFTVFFKFRVFVFYIFLRAYCRPLILNLLIFLLPSFPASSSAFVCLSLFSCLFPSLCFFVKFFTYILSFLSALSYAYKVYCNTRKAFIAKIDLGTFLKRKQLAKLFYLWYNCLVTSQIRSACSPTLALARRCASSSSWRSTSTSLSQAESPCVG